MSQFIHLHGHTEYSLLDGLSKVKKLVKAVKDMNMNAVAMTDHGVMYGAIEFYKSCLESGIKPIIGCEFYVAKRSHKDKEGKLDTEPFHLTALAKNHKGYLNLMKLVSIAHLEGYYYKPRVDLELLKQFHEGLIVLSGCPGGQFAESLTEGSFKEGEEIAKKYLEIFGEGNYFLELQNHEYDMLLKNPDLEPKVRVDLQKMATFQQIWWKAIKSLSPKLGIPIVATNDYHYVNPDDALAQDAILCVQTGKFIKDVDRLRMVDTPNLYIRSGEEMANLFSDLPEAITNTAKIADQCSFEMTLGKPIFPIFDIPGGLSAIDHLRQLCYERFNDKYPEGNHLYRERLDYELSVIEAKNFAIYILIVNDFIHWAHEQRIITNTRGSAAGSLALYLLGITNVDPVVYLLPFERFLNPLRPKFPDIDSDIADDRREDIIKYITEKYGKDRVAQIVTFGTMQGRAAIRDIGRVMGMAYSEVDRVAKLVPPPHQGFHKDLGDALKEVPELAGLYRENPEIKSLIDLAKKVEGTVRHASVHAAGVVISPTEMTDFTPLQKESNGDKIICQYDMFSISEEYEGVGLIKLDLLGIRNLSILGHSVEIVKQNCGIEVDLDNLPLDDKKTFELLGRGETMGLFQLEGSGMTRYLMELKPTSIFDISAMIALYRPGPLASIPDYIARKNNPSRIKYLDPRMKEYMERSLGLLVYQEDVLFTTINLAGYDWAQADAFRKAMGKKKPEVMAKEKERFVKGCVEHGMRIEKAEELFSLIEKFAAYGFGKAHSASYAMISYQTAYMKANFPVEFMAAVMTAEYGNAEKIAAAMEECKRMGIVVMPPDVNKSGVGFTLENLEGLSEKDLERKIVGEQGETQKQAIRFGLSAIKNVGISAIESILDARNKGLPAGRQGEFKSLVDLCSRADNRLVNRKTLESLIKAGALDSFGSRAAHLLILDQVLERVHQQTKKGNCGQVSLFGEDDEIHEIKIPLPETGELSLEQLLIFEKDLLGFYLHEPPFLSLLKQIGNYVTHRISDIGEDLVGKKVIVGGVLTEVKKVTTKKSNAEMAFIKISDGLVEIESVVFPTTFALSKHFLEKDRVMIINGKIDKREEQLSLVVESIAEFDPEVNERQEKEVEIMVPAGCGVDVLKEINITLREYPGTQKVALFLPNGGGKLKKMSLPFGIKVEPVLIERVEELLGKGVVKQTF